jgi:type II secretory pathway component GspD/PulD (secretin)
MKMAVVRALAMVLVSAGGLTGMGQTTQVGEGNPQVQGAAGAGGAANAATARLTQTMMFKFENAPVETVLSEMSARFGLRVVMMGVVPGKITIMVPEPVDAEEAVSLLSTVLLEQKFAVIQRPVGKAMELRVMPWERAKKEAPVYGGNDD